MPVKQEGDFLEFKELGIAPSLGLESRQLQECIEEVKRRGWLGVFGNPDFGFKEDHLDWMMQMPDLIQVWFWDVDLKSIEGLYALEQLRYFGIHPRRPGIDFSHFPQLETIVWFHNKKDKCMKSLQKLRDLHVWHFKPRSGSFDGLEIPDTVERLDLNWANPDSLSGLPSLPRLKHLEIHRCRNLISLESLDTIAPNLETLVIGSSNKVKSETLPNYGPSLKRVLINGQSLR